MKKALELIGIVLGSALFGLIVAMVLSGISASGVVGMEITHAFFWIAFILSVVIAPIASWLVQKSFKTSLICLVATAVTVGGSLWRLDSWLTLKKAEQDAVNQPPPSLVHTYAPAPSAPIIKTSTSQPTRPHVPQVKLPTTVPTNSIIENAGKLEGSEISGSEVTAPSNGTATVLRNLPGAEASNTKIENSHVSSVPASGPKSGNDNTPAILLNNSKDNEISGITFCGPQTAIRTKGTDTGNVFRDNSLNDPTHCDWIMFLHSTLDHRTDIKTFMDHWEMLMEQSWSNLPSEKRDSNRAELEVIKKRIIDSSGTRFELLRLIALLGKSPPSFEVKQP